MQNNDAQANEGNVPEIEAYLRDSAFNRDRAARLKSCRWRWA